jgi:tetratricopeptide (TPR) repeat protein
MFDTRRLWATIGRITPVLLLLIALTDSRPLSAQRAETRGSQSPSLIAGRDAIVNYGLTPEQVQELTKAAAAGAVGPLADRIVDLSNRLGVTQGATLTMLRTLDQRDVPLEQLPQKLAEVATQYQKAQAQLAALNPENPLAHGLVEEARAEAKVGNFTKAHQLLDQAKQAQIAAAQQARKLLQKAQVAEEEQLIQAAASSAAGGDLAMTELHYPQAAELFKEAANLVPQGSAHDDKRIGYLEREAVALYKQGKEFGDNDALRLAIERGKRLAELALRERMPSDWAKTQIGLGDALTILGQREAETARLEEAVTAYRAVLTEEIREQVTVNWWTTAQIGLGDALTILGQREGDSARLEDAIAAYRAALTQQPPEQGPLDRAATQAKLGIALSILGKREHGVARLEESVAAYHAALTEKNSKRQPLEWARTQINLGNALIILGELDKGMGRLEEAILAYRAALTELTRERGPIEWAKTQVNLGNALKRLGEGAADTARLEEAVLAYRAAATELSRERAPLEWAGTQTSLGVALQRLGEREGGTTRLEEALAAYRAAETELRRERASLDWAISVGNQGIVMMSIAERRRNPTMANAGLDQIIAAFEAMRDGGHALFAAFYETQLTKAKSLVTRLQER